jgi:SAM-dependent methyltransferase
MSDPAHLDPTGRFTGLAGLYARHRPDYPQTAVEWIRSHCSLEPSALLVDIGCGTGISSRQFAHLGVTVIGIEPNADMRREAESITLPEGAPRPSYRAGRAEATGLADCCADLVIAAQAFHWFDPEPALREFRRILKPGGWAALLWNERDEDDAFTAAYGFVVRSPRGAAEAEARQSRGGEPLLVSPQFQRGERRQFPHAQAFDEAGMLGRAMSVSYAPREPDEIVGFKTALREVFARFQQNGQVVLRYQTTVVLAQRQDQASAKRR